MSIDQSINKIKSIFTVLSAFFFTYILILAFFLILKWGSIFIVLSHEFIDAFFHLSIIIGFCIAILSLSKIWKIKLTTLFKKLKFKYLIYSILVAILIFLLHPLFNISHLFENIKYGTTSYIKFNDFIVSADFNSFPFTFKIIYTILLMPILEEVFYRGIILTKLKQKNSYVIAVIVSSLLFAVGHLDFEKAIYTFFSGLILGYIFVKSNNIILVIGIHIIINILFVLFNFASYSSSNIISISVLMIFVYAIFLLFLIFSIKQLVKENGVLSNYE